MEPTVVTSLSTDSDAGANACPHSQHDSEIAGHDPGLQLTFRSDSVSLTQIISERAKTRLCAVIAKEPYVILIFFAK